MNRVNSKSFLQIDTYGAELFDLFRPSLRLDSAPTLQRWFEFHWQILGNPGGELLVTSIAELLGLEAAAKLVVVLILCSPWPA